MPDDNISSILQEVLCSNPYFLQSIHDPATDLLLLIDEIGQFEDRLNFSARKTEHAISSMLRHSLLMTVVPAKVFDSGYRGSIDDAIDEHASAIGISLSNEGRICIRNICINIIKLRGLTGTAARNATKSLADIRSDPRLYAAILLRQRERCVWCGVDLNLPVVKLSLEHMAPKHIGDDMADSSNWAISCTTCNSGKADSLAWASNHFAVGYLRAKSFVHPNRICSEARWAILARDRKCDSCGKGATEVELGIHLQVPTGLAIPQNCVASCYSCAVSEGKSILQADWESQETGRSFP